MAKQIVVKTQNGETKMKLTASQKAKVERAIEQHETHKKCYFWAPPTNASGRRYEEKKNTWSVKFKHNGHVYEYSSDVRCSCKNYYYTGTFSIDGELKNVTLFKKLLKN